MLVVEFLGGLDFLLEKLHSFLAVNWVRQVEDLERILCIVCIGSKLHFGAETRAQCLAESKSIDRTSHFVFRLIKIINRSGTHAF